MMVHEQSPETYRSTDKMTKSLLVDGAEHIKQNKYSHKNFNLDNAKFKSDILPKPEQISKPEIVIASKNLINSPRQKKSSHHFIKIESVRKMTERKAISRKTTQLIYPELVIDGESPPIFQGTQQEHML